MRLTTHHRLLLLVHPTYSLLQRTERNITLPKQKAHTQAIPRTQHAPTPDLVLETPYILGIAMAEMNKSTVAHSKEDIAANPGHVQAQQLEAMTPAATRPTSPAAQDDDEREDDKQPEMKSTSRKPKQKKIAVLTSGGDSAGMNAAGRWE